MQGGPRHKSAHPTFGGTRLRFLQRSSRKRCPPLPPAACLRAAVAVPPVSPVIACVPPRWVLPHCLETGKSAASTRPSPLSPSSAPRVPPFRSRVKPHPASRRQQPCPAAAYPRWRVNATPAALCWRPSLAAAAPPSHSTRSAPPVVYTCRVLISTWLKAYLKVQGGAGGAGLVASAARRLSLLPTPGRGVPRSSPRFPCCAAG